MKNTTKSLIIAVSSVVVLVGAFLAVYYLVPTQEEEDTGSTTLDSLSSKESDEEHYHLMSYSYSDIDKIVVDNSGGEYTLAAVHDDNVQGTAVEDTNKYSIVGFEDLSLKDGNPQMLAEDAASVTASKIVNDGSKKSDFGFDSPRSVVTVTLTSGQKKTITVGDDAPGGKGAYLRLDGDKSIYLVSSESVDGLLLTKMGMFSTDIGTIEDDDTKFTKMKFGGTAFNDKNIVFDYNSGTAYTETFFITSPDVIPAKEDNTTSVMNNIRYLSADEVIAVDVDEDDLKKYGLDKPYITIEAEYPDMKVRYKAAKPKDDGSFYLLNDGIVYSMAQGSAPWILYKYEDYIPDEIISPKYDSVDKITVIADKKEYVFDIDRTSSTVRDDSADTDIETFTVEVKCNGKELDENIYSTFFNNLTSAKRSGYKEVDTDKKPILTVMYEYSDGTNAKAEYYKGENRKCPVLINGSIGTAAFETYVTKIIDDVKNVAQGKEIKSIN